MASFIFSGGGGGGGAAGVTLVHSIDFTQAAATDISSVGTHNILNGDGSALCTIINSTDAGSGVIQGTNNININSSGIVVDVSSGSGAENVNLAVALPTTLKSNFDVDYLMFEWLVSAISMDSNNSYQKYHVSTASSVRGNPSNGLVVIRSRGPTTYDLKGSRQYNTSEARTNADQNWSDTSDLHIQLLMRRHSGVVYQGTGSSFAEPYTLSTSFGLGGRSWPATRPVGQTSMPQWSTPYAVFMQYLNTTNAIGQAPIKKFRIAKFSPSVG